MTDRDIHIERAGETHVHVPDGIRTINHHVTTTVFPADSWQRVRLGFHLGFGFMLGATMAVGFWMAAARVWIVVGDWLA